MTKTDDFFSLLQRESGRRQANSALQLISQHQHQHPASLVTATFSPRILPPAGKNRPPEFKQRLSHEAHELFGSLTTRRAARRDFAAGRQKPVLQTQSDVITSYVARFRGANAQVYRFSSAEQPSKTLTSNFTQVEFPMFSGIRFFPVRRAKFGKGLVQRSPRAALFGSLKSKIKIQNSIFRRPPSAVSVEVHVQASRKRVTCANRIDSQVRSNCSFDLSAIQLRVQNLNLFPQNRRLGGFSRRKEVKRVDFTSNSSCAVITSIYTDFDASKRVN
ncbi:hypothetical protein R3P38DRAFT_2773860 [Favolaschia claudopus]|uniref:Uncharacterized protein n=1 Tax=Favolaschia claudopus TaxID=2862362 RepID=A0AAW0C4N2_9AGAR